LTTPVNVYEAPAMPVVKLVPAETVIFVCDIQTRFESAIHGYNQIVDTVTKMLRIAKVLEIPILVTEQNPKALGATYPEIVETINSLQLGPLHLGTIHKSLFSMVTPEVKAILSTNSHCKSVLLLGIESHVCVLQTALDLLELSYNVHVVADGVSSCNQEEVPIALARIRQAGGQVTTSESAAFQLQHDAANPNFKAFSTIIKEEKRPTKKAMEVLCQYRTAL
jgi:nicotinamidase-related amidase